MMSDKMSRPLKMAIRLSVFFLLIFLLVFAILVITFDVNEHKSRLQAVASELLDRDVELRGEIYIGYSLIPTVVVRNLHIANTDWATANDFAVIDRLSFNVQLFPLILDQRLVVDGVHVDGMRLNLEENQADENNWTLGDQDAPSQVDGLSAIEDIELANTTIVYRAPGVDEQVVSISSATVELDNGVASLQVMASYWDELITVSLDRLEQPLVENSTFEYFYEMQFKYRNVVVSANTGFTIEDSMKFLLADIVLQSQDKQQLPFDIHSGNLRWGMEEDLTLSLHGSYRDIPVTLEASAESMNTLFHAPEFPFKANLTSSKDVVEVEGELSGQLASPGINIENARINDTDFKGKLAIGHSEKMLSIGGRLESNKLSLDGITSLPIFKASQQASKESRPFKLPADISIDLELKVNDVDGLTDDISALQGKVSLRQGLLKISNVKLNALSGVATGRIEAANSARGVDYTINLKSQRVDVQKLLRGHKIQGQRVSGALQNITLDMKGPMVGADQLISQSRIELQAGKSQLSLQGAAKSDKESLQLDLLKLVAIPGQSIQASLQGQLRGSAFGLNLKTADYNALRQASRALPINLTATFADHTLHAEGKMGDMQVGQGLHVAIDAKGDNLQTLGPFLNTELPKTGAYKLTARLDATADDHKLSDIKGRIGDSDISGTLQVKAAEQRPIITADLNSKAFHYHDVFARQERQQDNNRLVPDLSIPVEFLKSFDSVIDVKAEKLFIGEVEYDDFVLHATLKDGYLQVEPFDSRLAGANVDGSLHVDTRQEKPATRFTLNSKDTDYGGLLQSFGWTDKVEGLGDVEIDLQGSGSMLRETLANSSGYIQLVAGKGTIKEPRFDLWAAGLVNSMLSSAWETKEVTSVQCIVGRFDIEDGMVTSDTLMLDTTEITVAGTASIDLKSEMIDAVITPAPKNPSLISMANPVKLSGNLHSPEVSVEKTLGRRWGLKGLLLGLANPATLLVLYSDLGTGVQNPCLEAVKKREAKEVEAEKEGTSDSLKLPGGNLLKRLLPGED